MCDLRIIFVLRKDVSILITVKILSGTAKGPLAFKQLNGIRMPVLVINGVFTLKRRIIFVRDHYKLFAS